ncbi:MAG TPA: xanthine dehydrogenase family protein subunit M [Xanthobacteraceae bacterium]
MAGSPLFRPRLLAEALELLAETPDARPISGGATLVAMINAGLVAPPALVSLTRIEELRGVNILENGDIFIGAAVKHNAIATDGRLTGTAGVVSHAASQIAGTAVRNMGTIGGALSHADPGQDFPPALCAVDAVVEVASKDRRRKVPVREFFIDWFTTALEPGEIVVGVKIPKPVPGVGLYLKHARVSGDFAIASVALSVAADGQVRVAIGGCGPKPITSGDADAILSSEKSRVAIGRAGDILTALSNPLDDVRGSAAYRRLLIPRMLQRAIEDAAASKH